MEAFSFFIILYEGKGGNVTVPLKKALFIGL